jgi:hypothetical protein
MQRHALSDLISKVAIEDVIHSGGHAISGAADTDICNAQTPKAGLTVVGTKKRRVLHSEERATNVTTTGNSARNGEKATSHSILESTYASCSRHVEIESDNPL